MLATDLAKDQKHLVAHTKGYVQVLPPLRRYYSLATDPGPTDSFLTSTHYSHYSHYSLRTAGAAAAAARVARLHAARAHHAGSHVLLTTYYFLHATSSLLLTAYYLPPATYY